VYEASKSIRIIRGFFSAPKLTLEIYQDFNERVDKLPYRRAPTPFVAYSPQFAAIREQPTNLRYRVAAICKLFRENLCMLRAAFSAAHPSFAM